MRIALLTLHTPLNFGSALQAFALCSVLSDRGHEVELVDYWRPGDRGSQLFLARLGDGDGPFPTRTKEAVGRTIEGIVARRRFWPFLRARTLLSTRRYRSYEVLAGAPPDADVYMTGSDQVWNSVYNGGVDRALYLDFGADTVLRVAYAASFGLDSIPSSQHDEMKHLLRRFDAISTRERQGVEILSELGFSADSVLDPTLLIDQAGWRFVAGDPEAQEEYVLCYCVEEKYMQDTARIAKEVALRMGGCRVYNVTFGGPRRRMRGVDRNLYFSSPKEFLKLFAGAAFVVTGSFHGTAFSLNFNKPFLSLCPPLYGSRVRELLELVGLSDRLIAADGVADMAQIDYSAVNVRLQELRASSLEFLDAALGGGRAVGRHGGGTTR